MTNGTELEKMNMNERKINNDGIGALYATFCIRGKNGKHEFTKGDVGDAVTLTGNNEIGRECGPLLGRLEHVGDNLATVQVRGVVRLKYAYGGEKTIPVLRYGVRVDYNNKVVYSSSERGITIAVDAENHTCDVLL